jgi:hypothetical protein
MRTRRTIINIAVAVGIVISAVGLWLAGQTSSLHSAEVFIATGVALMAGGGIYSLALDDAEARAKALGSGRRQGEGREIDLRTLATLSSDADDRLKV